jgi:hypothetical protein
MSQGVYGTTIPTRITSDDVDIFFAYHETRNSDSVDSAVFTKLPSSILTEVLYNGEDQSTDNVLEGLYNLKLPLTYFNKKGFYTVYIKPKEIPAVIADVSTLSAYQNVRGLVFDQNSVANAELKSRLSTNNELVGYRIVYINDNGESENFFRLVTSNNRCEPIVQSSSDSSNRSYTYRYNESSTMTFVTVTPSSSPSFKSNILPYIGKPTQKVLFVNTLFEPIMLDIEMTDHDIDTVSYMLEGSQLRDLDNGLVTTFTDDNQIYHQSEHYTLKDNGVPVFEVKKNKKGSIDFTQTLEDKL